METHVPEFDRATELGWRQVLPRLVCDYRRTNVENLSQAAHRRISPLEEVHHPPERDHWPG